VSTVKNRSSVTSKAIRDVERLSHLHLSGVQPESEITAPQHQVRYLGSGQIEPVA
jgi:hypothetical protein